MPPSIPLHVSKLAGAQVTEMRSGTRRISTVEGFLELVVHTSLGSPVGMASSLKALDPEACRIGKSTLPARPNFWGFSDMVEKWRCILSAAAVERRS